MDKIFEQTLRPQTLLVRGGMDRTSFGETSEPIFLNSGFVYETAEQSEARFAGEDPGFVYSRYGNPTVSVFEERLALLEGAEKCFATASGMAAVFAALGGQVRAGDKVVASRALFGSCHVILTDILPRWGVETELVDGTDLDQWRDALKNGAKAVFFETPANPTLELIDIQAVSQLAHEAGASVVIDNVFSTPILQKPMQLGADVVIYSGTKHIDGQGRAMGGAVLCSQSFYDDTLLPFVRHTGPAISPFNAWIMLKGLETLDMRVARHCDNAEIVVGALSGHNKIERVHYPFHDSHPQLELAKRQMTRGSTTVSFDVGGGKEAAFRMLNALNVIDISNNVGDAKSLITHPATTTHRAMGEDARLAMGITDSLVRLSVGLEDANDLTDDIRQALEAA